MLEYVLLAGIARCQNNKVKPLANNTTPVVGTSIQLRQQKLTLVTCAWSNYEIPRHTAKASTNRRTGSLK